MNDIIKVSINIAIACKTMEWCGMITTWLRIPMKCLYHPCTMHLSWDVDCPNKIFSQFIYYRGATELNSNSMAYESSPSTITEWLFDNAPAFDKHLV